MELGGVSGAVAILGTALALLVAIGAAAALVRGAYNKAAIEALQGDNDRLRQRLDDRDEELAEAERKHAHELELRDEREQRLEDKCNHLEGEVETLRAMVTQRADVEAAREELRAHHREVMLQYRIMIRLLALPQHGVNLEALEAEVARIDKKEEESRE